jgi:hypothetical protein
MGERGGGGGGGGGGSGESSKRTAQKRRDSFTFTLNLKYYEHILFIRCAILTILFILLS